MSWIPFFSSLCVWSKRAVLVDVNTVKVANLDR
jgi:hypothetical protein